MFDCLYACRYHFLQGFEHIVIYLDFENPTFTAMLLESLHKELALEKITLFFSFPLSKSLSYNYIGSNDSMAIVNAVWINFR